MLYTYLLLLWTTPELRRRPEDPALPSENREGGFVPLPTRRISRDGGEWAEKEGYFGQIRVPVRSISIPPDVEDRIRGVYPKAKLQAVWLASTGFEPGKDYTQGEVDEEIARSLSRLDECPRHCDTSHVRVALCELHLLRRTPDGSRYWKELVP